MEQFYYLGALLISIAGLMTIDHRWKLAFWDQPKRTALVLIAGIAVFSIWDFFGISLGIFFKGGAQYMLPFVIFPEFPVEELFFLFLLCYVTLLLFRWSERWQRI
jgi:lycopene cyclase domain-containing protein